MHWFVYRDHMTENRRAKYVKFWFHVTLLMNSVRKRVILSVPRNLAILQIMQLLQRRGLGPLLCYVMGLNERQ